MSASDRIIPAGGPLHLPDALAKYPSKGLCIVHRVSESGQAGPGKSKLIAKARAVMKDVRDLTPKKIKRMPFYGVEKGKLSNKRPSLVEAAQYAKEHDLILVAADLSRFIRTEAFHHHTNPNAWPADEEFARLRKLTLGVPLATVLEPTATESERISKATKRRGNAGRPRGIPLEKAWKILLQLGSWDLETTPNRWERPLREVAKDFGVTPQAIKRLLDTEVTPGKKLKYLMGLDWTRGRMRDQVLDALASIYERKCVSKP